MSTGQTDTKTIEQLSETEFEVQQIIDSGVIANLIRQNELMGLELRRQAEEADKTAKTLRMVLLKLEHGMAKSK